MTNSRISRTCTTLAALLLALLIVGPMVGIPPDVSGIPVWYQDTFFYACMVMAIAGVIAVTGRLAGYFQQVQWNYVDLGVLVLCLYMTMRTSLMDFIPQSAWIQIAYLAGSYFTARILWSSINTRGIYLFVAIILVAGILETGYGLGQLYGLWPSHHHLYPLTGSFFNPGPYSGWLACVMPLAIFGALQKKDSTVTPG